MGVEILSAIPTNVELLIIKIELHRAFDFIPSTFKCHRMRCSIVTAFFISLENMSFRGSVLIRSKNVFIVGFFLLQRA